MNAFHIYDLSTGLFTGRLVRSSNPTIEFLQANTPEGCGIIQGVADHLSQRVDIDSGMLVDYIPPSPGEDYEWDAGPKRWVLRAEVADNQRRRGAAIEQIDALERASLRPLRECRIAESEGRAPPEAAAARLKQIEAQIEALRPDLTVSAGRETG